MLSSLISTVYMAMFPCVEADRIAGALPQNVLGVRIWAASTLSRQYEECLEHEHAPSDPALKDQVPGLSTHLDVCSDGFAIA